MTHCRDCQGTGVHLHHPCTCRVGRLHRALFGPYPHRWPTPNTRPPHRTPATQATR